MKKLIGFLISILLSSMIKAQNHLDFMGIPIDGETETFCKKIEAPEFNRDYSENTIDTKEFEDEFKKDVDALNSTLPQNAGNGMWMWSVTYSNKVMTFTVKLDKDFHSFLSDTDNMDEEYAKATVKNLGREASNFAKYGISIRLEYRFMEDNRLGKEITITPSKIQKYYDELQDINSHSEGNRPLSYYQRAFTMHNNELPKVLDDVTTCFNITMEDNIVYTDLYLDDFVVDLILKDQSLATMNEIKKSLIDEMISNPSPNETKEDFKTYKIKKVYRYYYKSTKKLAFDITIDLGTDLYSNN